MPEQDLSPSPDTLDASEEYTANGGVQAEQTVAVDGLAPEMPASHPEVDAKTISVDGLIKACPHFANIAARNPELARAKATEVVQHAREHEAIRESGMSDAEIKKQQWAAMRERHKQKMQINERQDVKSVPDHPPTAERAQETIIQQATTSEEQIAQIVSEQTKPVVSEPEKIIEKQVETMQRLQYEAAQAAQQDSAIGRLVYEQQIHEAAQIVAPKETDQAFVSLEPQPVVGRELNGWMDEQTAIEPASRAQIELTADALVTAETTSSVEQIEPIGQTNELDEKSLYSYEDFTQEDFTQALQRLITSSRERPALETDEPTILDEHQLVVADEKHVAENVPDIAMAVAERLSEIEAEEKAAVSLVIADIMEIVQTVEMLEAEEAEPETVETMQAELEEHTIELFEQLGIEYETEDIEKFIAVLFRSDFLPPQTKAASETVDLEHDGTHEAKHHFPQLFNGMSDGKDKTQDFLGKLTLFYVLGNKPRTQMLAS